MVMDVKLHVCGMVHSLACVRTALSGHRLRMLQFHRECFIPPPSPSNLHSSSHVSPPPPPLSPPKSVCTIPKRKQTRQDCSPSPALHDSDETTLGPSLTPTRYQRDFSPELFDSPISRALYDSDNTTLGLSPTPSRRQRDFSPELFDSPIYSP